MAVGLMAVGVKRGRKDPKQQKKKNKRGFTPHNPQQFPERDKPPSWRGIGSESFS